MAELSQRDLLSILEFVRGAVAIGGPRTFTAYVTSELSRVIPSALTAYAEIELVKRSVRWVMDPADAGLPNAARVLAAHIPDNPFLLYRKRTGDAGTVRLSDLTTARAFRQTGLYHEFYRPLRVKQSMACALRLGPQELVAVALYRNASDFSERDRLCLDLLRPHLVHLHRSAEAMSRIRRDLALVTRGVEAWAQAFLIVGREGRIRRATEGAERWLTRYFDDAPHRGRLPARLREWLRWHETARAHPDALAPAPRPLVVERLGRRLTVRLVSQPTESLLLLEETATRLEPAVLARLGLSSREAEVLAWVAAGKTNPAVADLLHISPRTVQTHLERIYRKLGVETRTAATARALEAMRDAPVGEA
ncbi:MAG TPA: helix-turn-helix transcriptional regulator [Methylomirabilota bacterium]|jgi:DNA-binding CsgD family transcriptional regulator|nr:helix-turn-helix transcriptional regulator [Methylomirabilota bacterium]